MDVKLYSVWCLLLLVGLAHGASIGTDEDAIKDEDEDIYGDLGDSDTPKDEAHDVSYYDDNDDDKKIGQSTMIHDNDINIKIISKPEHLARKIGDVVRLPCQSDDRKADVIRSWYLNGQNLYQGQVAIRKFDNIRLNGTSLEVRILDNTDFGEYNCTLFIREHMNPHVIHTIYPPQQPTIVKLETSNNRTKFHEGEDLSLVCQATGYPKPKITWHSHHGEKYDSGENIVFTNITAKQDGSYRCLADNNVGNPAHAYIVITVEHKPYVEVEKYFINSDHRKQAELICHVDASPSAHVLWKKNGVNINLDGNKKFEARTDDKKNVLIIKTVDESDFAEYTCLAGNKYGSAERNINLVKLPVVQEFHKPKDDSKDVILTWKVESKQPISQHELQYRKKGDETWRTITPQVGQPDNDVYLIKHTLSGLEPGIYETRARSRNNHGWSNYSEIMPFEGVLAKHGSQHQKPKHHKNKDKHPKDHSDILSRRNEDIAAEDHSDTSVRRNEDTPVGAQTVSSASLPVSSLPVLVSAIFLLCIQLIRP